MGSDPEWDKFPAVRRTLERWQQLEQGSSPAQVFDRCGIRVAKLEIPGRSPAAAVVEYLDRDPVDMLVVASVTFATTAVLERHFRHRASGPMFVIAGYVATSRSPTIVTS